MTYQEFKEAVSELEEVTSTTGVATYSNIKVVGDKVNLLRDNTGEYWDIDLKKIYDFYENGVKLNTTEAKEFGLSRKQSPAVAIVWAIKNKQR